MNLPLFGVFHNFAFLSIDKRYPFQAKKVMHGIWGMGQMMFTKIIVVVDKDVNVQNVDEVMWRVGNNVDPTQGHYLCRRPDGCPGTRLCSAQDRLKDGNRRYQEVGLKKVSQGSGSDDIKMSPEIVNLVNKKWNTYGI